MKNEIVNFFYGHWGEIEKVLNISQHFAFSECKMLYITFEYYFITSTR